MFIATIPLTFQTKTSQELQLPFIQLFSGSRDHRHRLSPESIEKIFGPYIPPGALDMLIVCLQGHDLECRVTRNRATKCGDFRPSRNNQLPRITVNRDLNPYAFLLTLIHEVAHFFVYLETEKSNLFLVRKHRPRPHGIEWKKRFTGLMQPFISQNIFPQDIEKALVSYFENPGASASSDARLQRLLQGFDPPGKHLRVSEIPDQGLFVISTGRVFLKMERLRKRYRCMCMKTKRIYLVNPDALVLPVKQDGKEKLL
jgi:hypothetical protein